MKFYVCHYMPAVERKLSIEYQFTKAQIHDYEFEEQFDRENLNFGDLNKFTDLSLAEISLFNKHLNVLKRAPKDDYITIFEDDAVLVDDFQLKLNNYLSQLTTQKWDILFASDCCDLHVSTQTKVPSVYPVPLSRGACCYILNKGVCKKLVDIYESYSTISKPYDHWLNDIATVHPFKYYWSEPTIVYQGSEIGLFESTLKSTEPEE